MKIKTTNNKTIDTDKLSDKEDEIIKAVDNLYKVCDRYNATMITRVVVSNKNYVGAQTFCNAKNKKNFAHSIFLLDILGKFVEELTDGKCQLFKTGE